MSSLNELNVGQSAVIDEICVTGSIRRRLLDMGLIRGTRVMCVLESPQKDPKAFSVRGSVIAVREEESQKIKILKEGQKNDQ